MQEGNVFRGFVCPPGGGGGGGPSLEGFCHKQGDAIPYHRGVIFGRGAVLSRGCLLRGFHEAGSMKGWDSVKDSAMKEPLPPVGQQAGSTHPTEMHSCSDHTFLREIIYDRDDTSKSYVFVPNY